MTINIISADPSSEIITFAVSELARYLGRILPEKSIILESPDSTDNFTILLKVLTNSSSYNDCFHISINETGGSIMGNCQRSILLGVYDYLHALGCRFLMPGSQGEILPQISPEQLYMQYEKEATFFHRGVCIEGANSLENILDFIDWLPKAGYNSFFLQFKVPYTFLARWYHHEQNPFRAPSTYTVEDARIHMDVIEKAIMLRGLLLHKAGHGWTGEVLGFSALEWKEDTRLLTHQQTQMIAQLDGQRKLFCGIPANTNLCFSNPDAKKGFVNRIVSYAEEHPNVDYLHVWLADEYNNVCECNDCKKTTPSDQYVRLLNEVDKALSARGLSAKIVFLIYLELLWPPLKEQLHNPERFVLMFAPISRTFEASYELTDSTFDIPPYKRNQITLPVDISENLSFLKKWQQVFSGDSFIYDYPLGRAHYGDFGYVHIAKIIGDDIKKLHQMGLNGYISCQELRVSLPNVLPNYVMGKLLFNDSLHTQDIIEEYFQAAYGSDASRVQSYLSQLSDLCSCDYFNGIGNRTNPDIAQNMACLEDVVCMFRPILDSHLLPDGEWENIFWKLLDYHWSYILRLGKALFELSSGDTKKAQKSWMQFRQFICENESDYQEFWDVYRVLEVSTKYTRFLNEKTS